mmetsp:Transcript_123638/g.276031  ORF Transcript_123638/g.276031 Transcript_123638/m.276031 type:complete len:345 (+) Transcript_123638:90-1124(+)
MAAPQALEAPGPRAARRAAAAAATAAALLALLPRWPTPAPAACAGGYLAAPWAPRPHQHARATTAVRSLRHGRWRRRPPRAPTSLAAASPATEDRADAGGVDTSAVEEIALEDLQEVVGEYTTNLPPERLQALSRSFPTLNVSMPGLRLLHEDPPVFILEGLMDEVESRNFIEAMRAKDGSFPERLGQSDLPAIPSFLSPLKTMLQGVPVLDWLGNPTVRWTYRSKCLLSELLLKVRKAYGLDLEQGSANIKHYRTDQWLPVHIDYNHATMMAYLNEVDQGGHTIFPTLGFKVRPERGSALVWPNQPSLKHAGARVTKGEKWILFYNWPAEQNWEYDGNFDFNE